MHKVRWVQFAHTTASLGQCVGRGLTLKSTRLPITEAKFFGRFLYPPLVIPDIQSLSCYETTGIPFPNLYIFLVMTLSLKIHGLQKLQINPAVFASPVNRPSYVKLNDSHLHVALAMSAPWHDQAPQYFGPSLLSNIPIRRKPYVFFLVSSFLEILDFELWCCVCNSLTLAWSLGLQGWGAFLPLSKESSSSIPCRVLWITVQEADIGFTLRLY